MDQRSYDACKTIITKHALGVTEDIKKGKNKQEKFKTTFCSNIVVYLKLEKADCDL
jgi:hypothetical protein